MKSYQKILAVIALSGMCLTTAMASEGEVSAKKSKKHKTEEKAPCEACEAIKRLEEKVAAQQAEIDQLKGVKPATPGTTDAAAQAAAAAAQQQAAAAAAAAAEANAKAAAAQADVNSLKPEINSANAAAQDAAKRVSDLEAPAYIHYKGIRITPGGFLAAESVWRQHSETADIGSYYSGSHFPIQADTNTPAYNLTEFLGTARQSRISLLAEGNAGETKFTGYYEMDFLGAAATANENQSNSWQPRVRQLFGQASRHGWTLTAGQMWSLLTMNRKGTEARAEWVPATIDAQYIVGYTWDRQWGVRVAKTFADDKVTAAFSIENPQTLAGGTAPAGVIIGQVGAGQLGNGNAYTSNLAPDLIAKVAYDPSFGHFELKAIGRFFRDRIGVIDGAGTSNTVVAGGFGGGVIVPIVKRKLDFVAQTLVGRGIGRYGDSSDTTNAGDVTFTPSGSFSPLQNLQVGGGLEAHPTPKLDVYIYAGDEYIGRTVYTVPGALVPTIGYGLASANTTGCFGGTSAASTTTIVATCSPLTKTMLQGTAGFWYNFYKGPKGTFRFGGQYSYTYNGYWHATDGTPHANENMAFTSLRYYIP